MSIDHAVELMFKAVALARGGEVFVLKMPVLLIEDLAALLRDRLSPLEGLSPSTSATVRRWAHSRRSGA